MRDRSISYKLPNALELVCRSCQNLEANGSLEPFSNIDESKTLFTIFNEYASKDASDYKSARAQCIEWNRQLGRLITAFSVENEAEIVFGMVVTFNTHDMQPRGRSPGLMHFQEMLKVNKYSREMKTVFQARFFPDVERGKGNSLTRSEMRESSTWIMATNDIAEREKQYMTPLISSPFVVDEIYRKVINKLVTKR